MMVIVSLGVTTVQAMTSTVFPNDSGDLASTGEDGWKGPIPTDIAEILTPGPFTFSKDVSLFILNVGRGAASATFDLGGSTVTITDGANDYSLQCAVSDSDVLFRGGTIDFANGGSFMQGNKSVSCRTRWTFSGMTLRNLGNWFTAYDSGHDNTSVLTNGTSVSASGSVYISYCPSNSGGCLDNFLEVNAGCTLSAGGTLYSDRRGEVDAGRGGNMLIRGAGASVSAAQACLGYRNGGNVWTVTDGGVLSVSGSGLLYCGGNSERNASNRLEVLDGGSVSAYQCFVGSRSDCNEILVRNGSMNISYSMEIGVGDSGAGTGNVVTVVGKSAQLTVPNFRPSAAPTSSDTHVRILDGAVLSATTVAEIGQEGSRADVVVSNATFSAKVLSIGRYATGADNSLRLKGPDTSFSAGYASGFGGYFGLGARGLLEFSDGCTGTISTATFYLGDQSNGNVVRVTDGAALLAPSDEFGLSKGATASRAGSYGNRLEIGNGAYFCSKRLYLFSHDNTVVVSNGCLQCASSMQNGIILGHVDTGESASNAYGNVLRFEGESPRLRFDQTNAGLCLWNGAHLEFAVPARPYDEPPVVAYKIEADEKQAISIDTSALDGTDHPGLTYVLARVTSKTSFSDAVLDRANEELAGRGRLYWNGNDLVFRAKGTRGLLLLIR